MRANKNPGKINGLICLIFLILLCTSVVQAQDSSPKGYVGSGACLQCHQAEYAQFTKYARKSNSFQSVLKMKKGLTPYEITQCYTCHTTGYGKPGGFVSPEKTPKLKDAGCEVCHGPGRQHTETQNPNHIIRKVTIEVCQECHIEDRIRAFRYRPILRAGAH